jgi:hypothetical protein
MIDAARVSIDEMAEKSKELGRPSALNLHFNFKPSSPYSMATLLADLATELRMHHLADQTMQWVESAQQKHMQKGILTLRHDNGGNSCDLF